MGPEILYADAQLTVCLKRAGLVSEAGGMPELLRESLGGEFFCVHRLDKPVGGVTVYARTGKAAAALSAQIAAGGTEKEYLAVVKGVPEKDHELLRDLIYHDSARNKSYVVTRPRRGVREASLSYELLASVPWEEMTLSALRVALHTGRSHQIRVQFASRALPLVGDARYGSALRRAPLALWSHRLAFTHPESGERLSFSAPPPDAFPWELFSLHNI